MSKIRRFHSLMCNLHICSLHHCHDSIVASIMVQIIMNMFTYKLLTKKLVERRLTESRKIESSTLSLVISKNSRKYLCQFSFPNRKNHLKIPYFMGKFRLKREGSLKKKEKKENNLTPLKVEVLDGERKDKPKK